MRSRTAGSSCSNKIYRAVKLSATNTAYAEGKTEFDSHADTCIAGRTWQLWELTGEECQVYAYSEEYEPRTVKVGSYRSAWSHPITGEVFIMVLHQALGMEEQEPSLLCPNQLRMNGILVNDVPRSLPGGDIKNAHSMVIPEADLKVPLKVNGVMSSFDTRIPTESELETCTHIVLTNDSKWDPNSSDLEQQEENHENDGPEDLQHMRENGGGRQLFAMHRRTEVSAILSDVSNTLQDDSFLEDLEESVRVQLPQRNATAASAKTKKRHHEVTPVSLAKRWGIGLDTASKTIKVTTQKGARSAVHPLHRRYRTKQQQMRYQTLNCTMYSDTLFASTKSSRGNTMSQVFATDTDFARVVHMSAKSDAGNALTDVFQTVGVPRHMVTDGAKELTQGTWGKRIKEYQVKATTAEPYSQFQNKAETLIRELKKKWKRLMINSRAPMKLWDWCLTYVADTHSLTAHPIFKLDGRTPYEILTGNTPDISEYLEYDWYTPVWYLDPGDFPGDDRKIGRWLGVAHHVGQAMCYYILPESGIGISRTTVQPFSDEDMRDPDVKKRLKAFDDKIAAKMRKNEVLLDEEAPPEGWNLEPDELDDPHIPYEPEAEMPEADEYTEEALDKYLTARVLLPAGESELMGTVKTRKRDAHGHPVGVSHTNPILDTRQYDVEFDDGTIKEYSANVIAESIYARVDKEGNEYRLLEEIIEHRKDGHAVSHDDKYIVGKNGNKHLRRTTKGWQLLVKWKDGETSWTPLKDLKEGDPVITAEYAVANKIAEEPAFVWWVYEVLKKRDRIISKVKARYWKRTHKFGIEMPKTVQEAYALDEANGNTYWHDAIDKEFKNVQPAFNILDDDAPAPVGHQKIKCHYVFDIKMDFTRKARFVAGGHMTAPPATLTYSSVVSRDSVRIAFVIAALNGLDILAADIGNAYLNAPCREKIYFEAGEEFGNRKGARVIVVRALYGLKSSGAAWRAHCAETMRDMDFTPSEADPDVWMRKATKSNGFKYWEYVLIYVDDVLCVSEHPKKVMETLKSVYRLKEDASGKTYGPPDRYLGANIGKTTLEDGKDYWHMSSDDYVKEAVRNVKTELAKSKQILKRNVKGPMASGYRPELDVSPELGAAQANYYQNLIGVLRWMVELGRIDIHTEVALLSRYLAAPRRGHLEQAFHIFAYLDQIGKSRIVFDSTEPDISEARFVKADWKEFYPDAEEPISPNVPEARGNSANLHCFVDADHAGDKITRRSHTGILIFLNRAPIMWYSKRQNTIETSSFGSEFVAIKTAAEIIRGLRYKLRMFGIPMDGPTNVFCDNQSVCNNTQMPASTLKKKHLAICYHLVRELCAANVIRVAWENGQTNLADVLTKLMPASKKKEICGKFMRR